MQTYFARTKSNLLSPRYNFPTICSADSQYIALTKRTRSSLKPYSFEKTQRKIRISPIIKLRDQLSMFPSIEKELRRKRIIGYDWFFNKEYFTEILAWCRLIIRIKLKDFGFYLYFIKFIIDSLISLILYICELISFFERFKFLKAESSTLFSLMENEEPSIETKPIKFSDFKWYIDNSGNTARK